MFKECEPMKAIVERFPHKKIKAIVTVERQQFHGIIGHTITIHKAQKSLLNIRLCNGHIAHFITETIYPTTCSLLCYTETTSNGTDVRDIDSYKNKWNSSNKFITPLL